MTSTPSLLFVAGSLCVIACDTGGPSESDAQIATYVEIRLHHGFIEYEGVWSGGVAGYVTAKPYNPEGPMPAEGECNLRFVEPFVEGRTLDQPVVLSVDGVGTWDLVMQSDGQLGLEPGALLPTGRFVEAGVATSIQYKGNQASLTAPAPVAAINRPTIDAPVDVTVGSTVEWTPQSQEQVQLVLVLITAQGGFLGAQTCVTTDNGQFVLPPWPDAVPSATGAILHVRYQKKSTILVEATRLELWVRQTYLRRLTVVQPAPGGSVMK